MSSENLLDKIDYEELSTILMNMVTQMLKGEEVDFISVNTPLRIPSAVLTAITHMAKASGTTTEAVIEQMASEGFMHHLKQSISGAQAYQPQTPKTFEEGLGALGELGIDVSAITDQFAQIGQLGEQLTQIQEAIGDETNQSVQPDVGVGDDTEDKKDIK